MKQKDQYLVSLLLLSVLAAIQPVRGLAQESTQPAGVPRFTFGSDAAGGSQSEFFSLARRAHRRLRPPPALPCLSR